MQPKNLPDVQRVALAHRTGRLEGGVAPSPSFDDILMRLVLLVNYKLCKTSIYAMNILDINSVASASRCLGVTPLTRDLKQNLRVFIQLEGRQS